jgi:hypothetical protein
MIPVHALALAMLPVMPQQAEPAKPAETACVALPLPTVEGVEGDATSVASSVRALFESYLTGPSLKSVPLDARLASQAAEEARQKDCPTILTVTVTRKADHGSGHSKVGAIASAAGTTAAYIPLPNYGAAVAVGAARGGVEAIGSLAGTTHAKDEMTLTYKMAKATGATVLPVKSDTAKAKSNGEDLLTPLIARASETVAAAVTRK